jgi:hypothetical protein
LKDPPKFTQIWIFGLKTNHLATLLKIGGRSGGFEGKRSSLICITNFDCSVPQARCTQLKPISTKILLSYNSYDSLLGH